MLTRRRSARLQEAAAKEEAKVQEEVDKDDSPKTAAKKRAASKASSAEPPKARCRTSAKNINSTPKTARGKRNTATGTKQKQNETDIHMDEPIEEKEQTRESSGSEIIFKDSENDSPNNDDVENNAMDESSLDTEKNDKRMPNKTEVNAARITRKSVRRSKEIPSYKEEKDSSSDMSSDSESTFIDSDEEIPRGNKRVASRKKQRKSSTDSDDTDMDAENTIEVKQSVKKRTKKNSPKATTSRRNSGSAPKTKAPGRKGMLKPWVKHVGNDKVGDIVIPPRQMTKAERYEMAFKLVAFRLADGRDKEIDMEEGLKLFDQVNEEYSTDKEGYVRKVLSMGRHSRKEEAEEEKDDEQKIDDGSSSEDEWLEMEPVHLDEEPKKVEVTVGEIPVDDRTRRWAAWLRQEINKVVRERWENAHKVHILCYIAHLQYTVKVSLHEMTVPYLMVTQLPEGLAALQGESINLNMAKRIVVWFNTNFKPAANIVDVPKEELNDTRYPETARYAVLAGKKCYETDHERATLLFALFVGLEATARICVNTRPIPRRWDEEIIARVNSPKEDKKDADRKTKTDKKKKYKEEMDYWVEYWNVKEKRWICLNPAKGTVDDALDIEKDTHKPIHYIFAIDNKRGVRDVSARYTSDFLKPDFRRRRTEESWLARTLNKPLVKADGVRAELEDTHFRVEMVNRPLPTSLAEFKNHPLYVLEKDLLKFEAIYPPPSEQKELGVVKGHKVYPRDTVHCLQGGLNWIKLARSVKEGEKPYKVVKARLNPYIAAEGQKETLDVFGFWQTEPYRKEIVENGRIPRNQYGNVYMYQPTMCPIGAVHLRLPGLPSIARRLGKDCVAAVIGWEFSGCANHPIIEGACVCEEDADLFIEEWKKAEAAKEERQKKRREERIYGNWKKLITGIVSLRRVQAKFGTVESKKKSVKVLKKEEKHEDDKKSGIVDMTQHPKTKDMTLHDVMGFRMDR